MGGGSTRAGTETRSLQTLIPNSWANLSSAYLLCRTIYSVKKSVTRKTAHYRQTWHACLEKDIPNYMSYNRLEWSTTCEKIWAGIYRIQLTTGTYLTNALLPLLGTLTGSSKYVGDLLVIQFLRVPLPFNNLARLQSICREPWANNV